MTFDEFREGYLQNVRQLALEGDVFPVPFHVQKSDGTLLVCAIDANGLSLFQYVSRHFTGPEVVGLAVGIDRYTEPGQGCRHGSVFTYTIAVAGKIVHGAVDYEPGVAVETPNEREGFFIELQRENWVELVGPVWGTRG